MSPTSDAYILVTIPNATLTSPSSGTLTGQLVLEYVTYDIPPSAQVTQDVLLVLVLRSGNNTVLFEAPLDPARALSVSSVPPPPASFGVARRRYVFHATRDDTELTVDLPENNNNAADDVELFHSVLVGYITDVRVNGVQQLQSSAPPPPARVVGEAATATAPAAGVGAGVGADEDLRGRFVLMNEDDGEIVGTLDRSVRVYEDPSIGERGRENDTLVVEVPEGADMQDGLLEEEVLVSTIPPEERDWMLKTAVFVSHAISGTTTLLTSAMTSASNLYIAHSTPSTASAPGSRGASPRPTTPSASQKVQGQSHVDPPTPTPAPAPPSRTLLLLQSPTTRKNLTQIHAVSGTAAKLSNKAASAVESLIQRAIGSGSSTSSSNFNSNLSSGSSSSFNADKGKGRSSSDTVKYPIPQSQQPQQQQQAPTAPGPLRTRTSVALSAVLILASIEASAIRLVEAGGAAVSAAVTHKYGTTAGENAALAGRTARNIVLVYVDVRGLGRRVIVKRMAKTWVRKHIANARQQQEQRQAAAQKKR